MTALSKLTREQLNEEARRVGIAAPDAVPTVKELRETIAAFIENGLDPHGGAEGKNGGADEQTGAAHGMVGNASFDAAQGDSGDDGDEDDDSGETTSTTAATAMARWSRTTGGSRPRARDRATGARTSSSIPTISAARSLCAAANARGSP